MDTESYVEWDEPPRSPENWEWYIGVGKLARVAFPKLALIAVVWASGLLVLVGGSIAVTRSVPMALVRAYLLFGLAMSAVLTLGMGAIWLVTRSAHRRVRLSATGIRCAISLETKWYPFSEVVQVVVECAGDGAHRLIVSGAEGELCRLRVPSGCNIGAIVRFVPPAKLARYDSV